MPEYPEFHRNLRRESEFMMRLGEAITEWHSVELACYGIYVALMKGANKRLISVSFFHIQSFEARLLLLDRCLYFVLGPEGAKETWKPLRKRTDGLAILRNQLAHSAYIIEGHGEVQIPTLAPSHFDATAIVRGRALNPEYRIDGDKIGRIRHQFHELAIDLRAFGKSLSAIAK